MTHNYFKIKLKSTIKRRVLGIVFVIGFTSVFAQKEGIIPDLTKCNDTTLWHLHNRTLIVNNGEVHLSGDPKDGVLWLKSPVFKNGQIELDIKGKDLKGRSFIGVAFHGIDNETYDAVYFRPFNFQNPQKKAHSIQYISHPQFTWFKLRKDAPKVYENAIDIPLNPNEWFHVKLVVEYPSVKVYVNDSETHCLSIDQLSSQKQGWIGFWVGNNSEGTFKNLRIYPKEN
ncbi:family 16 glycoside hydrolase [Flavivirga algicola]|uniref:DUF1080 domain-containing protein n=1 Tax=Flavivirga algicola TaxID=2729136 RepID=A0ABX1RZ81_9FLAO|nr:family 16 glycoside hydrolase [Flavivirga algicola]NMH88905.1 DUF1080 domain-containing protein [Flavivirga algicola]